MAGSARAIDVYAKANMHGNLQRDRQALLWKLDGLSEYDSRRPLTVKIEQAAKSAASIKR
nr:DinB family protein [Glycomyces sp. YM15]